MNKKIIFRNFALAALTLVFASCEDVVQVKLDEGSKIYVVDAFVNDLRGEQKIRVVTNDSYFSNRQAPPVSNAAVSLIDLNARKRYVFNYGSDGYYVYNVLPGDTICRVNHQYQLEVTVDGQTYTSLATQKRTAGIDSIEVILEDGNGGGFGPSRAPYYRCELHAKDRTDANTDYYWIKTFRNDTLFAGPSGDLNLSIDGTNGPVTDIPVDSTGFTPPIIFLGFKEYQKNNTCKVEIHSISKDAYFFFVQASNQINNGGLFATTPENVKTNIITPKDAKTKAVGWFNVATVTSKTRVIR